MADEASERGRASKLVTFYSYKGGVGRTFALANVAVVLARWGYRVLCADWDLDAPGLHHYFARWMPGRIEGGLVEWISNFASGTPVPWQDLTIDLSRLEVPGSVTLLPAGEVRTPKGYVDERYPGRLQAISWQELYTERDLGRYLEEFRAEALAEYDIVLVDSRTGITDVGGICTSQLPDILVLCMSATSQSLWGAVDVARRVTVARNTLPYGRGGLLSLPVLSRFDSREEYQKAEEWRTTIGDALKHLYDQWLHKDFTALDMLERTTVPYVPIWSFGEELPALHERASNPELVTYPLEAIAALLAHRLENTKDLIGERERYLEHAHSRYLRPDIVGSASGGDRAVVGFDRFGADSPQGGSAVHGDPSSTDPHRRRTIYMSYAISDQTIVRGIRRWFRGRGYEVFDQSILQDVPHGAIIDRVEDMISEADAFVVLLSRQYLRSPQCRRERELASSRASWSRHASAQDTLIYVLLVDDVLPETAGVLEGHRWHDLRGFQDLGEKLDPVDVAIRRSPSVMVADLAPWKALGRGRESELNAIVNGLTTTGGQKFWLVTAPPGFGKSWLLDRLAIELTSGDADPADGRSTGWTTSLIDLGEQTVTVRRSAAALLTSFLSPGASVATPLTALDIARRLSDSSESRLWLLDGADLLEADVIREFRTLLGEIHTMLTQSGHVVAKLAVVVASRRDEGWLGLAPSPQLRQIPLPAFDTTIVAQAIDDLAERMKRRFDPARLRRDADLVHRFTEGSPVLLARCLTWLRRDAWLRPERLNTNAVFDELVQPYVEEDLLSARCLFPGGDVEDQSDREIMVHALRVLAPYRLFTASHLSHHLDSDGPLSASLSQRGWSTTDLWAAIGHISLLSLALDEPWYSVDPPVRRLLFRYFYRTTDDRLAAHRAAYAFTRQWTDSRAGSDLVNGTVECLWHLSALQQLEGDQDHSDRLCAETVAYRESPRTSPGFDEDALRSALSNRVRNDREIRNNLRDVPGLFERLVDTTLPAQGDHRD